MTGLIGYSLPRGTLSISLAQLHTGINMSSAQAQPVLRCSFLIVLLLAAATSSASAHQDALGPNGVSPDKRLRLFVAQQDDPSARIYYVLRNRKSGVLAGRFESSYQPDPASGDFAWQQSHPMAVYWRRDSTWVAIEEANHRGEGTVVLLHRGGKGFRRVPLSCERLMAATKENWDRGRLFFGDNCWLRHGRVRVLILGSVPNAQRDGPVRIGYDMTIDLRRNGAILRAARFSQEP